MARISIIVILIVLHFNNLFAQENDLNWGNLDKLKKSHDIRTSNWGPYTKKYAGISHIASFSEGLRFDFSVMPGYYRNRVLVPNVLFESSYFPWKINDALTNITYRYELEWKDRVFVDVTYKIIDNKNTLVEIKGVNNTLLPQNLMYNLMANLNYQDHEPNVSLKKTDKVIWKNAVDYTSFNMQQLKPQENLVHMGYKRGEIRGAGFVGSSAIGDGFGADPRDIVNYNFGQIPSKAKIGIVYQQNTGKKLSFKLSGLVNKTILLKPAAELSILYVDVEHSGNQLSIKSLGDGQIIINGFVLVPENETKPVIVKSELKQIPFITENKNNNYLTIKYPELANYYGIKWEREQPKIRYFFNDELDIFLREKVHKHVDSVFVGNNKGHYTNVFFNPITIAAQNENVIRAWITTGTKDEVEKQLKLDVFNNSNATSPTTIPNLSVGILPQGQDYAASIEKLQATLLSNVVFPLYTNGGYIRHFSPGKNWNSLYTWDGGFIALGLNDINKNLALDCINAYTTDVSNASAFMHHGSPIPVHIYALLDLYNKTQSKELLTYFYPRVKKMYEFLAGSYGSSTTRQKSGMIKTWDYFYNSGGWDDYPAQVQVHKQNLTATVAPVINTVHGIRVAKILKMFASALKLNDDILQFQKDIDVFTNALQTYSWNEKSNYFSYVVHDKNGNASQKFLNTDGEDMNRGLDGAYPLMAGICNPYQKRVLLDKIFSKDHLWTNSGMGVVDQAASYYKRDGYWNGAVWMPHQWFVWKTMLDLGEINFANKIALTALNVYNKETKESYYTFEHFFAESGRGAGWHQFSGLSSPILNWYASYFKIGTVTTGFEVLVKKQAFGEKLNSFKANLSFDCSTKSNRRVIMVCLNPNRKYNVQFNGKKIAFKELHDGLLQISLPAQNEDGELTIY